MFPCIVLGDSIAVGIGQYLPQCRLEARAGISSTRFVHQMLTAQSASLAVISLGVNDGIAAGATEQELRTVRRGIGSDLVVWVLPAGHGNARAAIATVAAEFHDRLIDAAPFAGRDGLHPTGAGYRALARDITPLSPAPRQAARPHSAPAASKDWPPAHRAGWTGSPASAPAAG